MPKPNGKFHSNQQEVIAIEYGLSAMLIPLALITRLQAPGKTTGETTGETPGERENNITVHKAGATSFSDKQNKNINNADSGAAGNTMPAAPPLKISQSSRSGFLIPAACGNVQSKAG